MAGSNARPNSRLNNGCTCIMRGLSVAGDGPIGAVPLRVARIVIARRRRLRLLPAEEATPPTPWLLLRSRRRLRIRAAAAPWRPRLEWSSVEARILRGANLRTRDQVILRVADVAVAVAAEILDEALGRIGRIALVDFHINPASDQVTPRLRRGRAERRFWNVVGPHGFHDRLEHRSGHARPGLAAAERAALAIGVVVSDPYRHRDVVAEAHKPGVVLAVGGAGLARHIRGHAGEVARGPALQHTLQHGLELIERDLVGRADLRQRRAMAVDHAPAQLDRFNRIGRRPRT